MDTRAELLTLARAIDLSGAVEKAWAGLGPSVDLRKHCGICREDQPVRVPFLRHVCRSCAAIWVPGICGDCASTSVTFTRDGQLSRLVTCGCGGPLRMIAYVPTPRAAVDPEVAAARKVVVETRKKRVALTSRTALVVVAVLCALSAYGVVQHNHAAPPPKQHVARQPIVADDPSQPMSVRGGMAAQRLRQSGRVNELFACAAQLPALPEPQPSASAAPVSQSNGTAQDFLAGCLKG